MVLLEQKGPKIIVLLQTVDRNKGTSQQKYFDLKHQNNKIKKAFHSQFSKMDKHRPVNTQVSQRPPIHIVPASPNELSSQLIFLGIARLRILDLLSSTGSPSNHPKVNHSSQPNEHIRKDKI